MCQAQTGAGCPDFRESQRIKDYPICDMLVLFDPIWKLSWIEQFREAWKFWVNL